ncbi:uncharacterized [Tachysurus ichikawai]
MATWAFKQTQPSPRPEPSSRISQHHSLPLQGSVLCPSSRLRLCVRRCAALFSDRYVTAFLWDLPGSGYTALESRYHSVGGRHAPAVNWSSDQQMTCIRSSITF